jgi:hypothetical protein
MKTPDFNIYWEQYGHLYIEMEILAKTVLLKYKMRLFSFKFHIAKYYILT